MLLKLREKTTGWIAIAIVVLLMVPFALVGIGDYFSTRVDTWVARVGEVEISQDQFRARFEDYRQQMRRAMGDNFDPREMEQPAVKRLVLDRMVDEELLRQASEQLGMTVPPTRLQQEIAGVSAFQVDGRFDPNQYRLLLASQNMSPRGFEARVRQDLQAAVLPETVQETGFATNADVDRFVALRDQQRDLRYVAIDPPAIDAVAMPTDEEVEAYYQQNAPRYMSEEQVTIEYVLLDSAAIDVPAQADEETLRQRYDEQRARYVEPEQRLASHVLIRVPPNADADVERAAQQRAAGIAERARGEGADFAAIARELSEDPGSKTAGGDLGWIEPGLTDPAFESALFALEAGAVSEPVKSAEGWHVIQLREVRAGKERPFEDVRAELEAEFQATERERIFSERAGQLVDAIYRDPTSLQAAAGELELQIQRAGPFGRAGGDTMVSSQAQVIEAAFSEPVLVEGNVSDVIDIGEGRMVALRVAEHDRPQPIPLADIRDQVVGELRAERLAEQAAERAEALLAQLRDGATLEAIAAELGVEPQTAEGVTRMAANVPPAIASEAFRLPHPADGAASVGLVDLGGNRHALLAVTAVRDGDPTAVSAAERSALAEQLGQVLAAIELEGLMEALRTQIPVELAEARI